MYSINFVFVLCMHLLRYPIISNGKFLPSGYDDNSKNDKGDSTLSSLVTSSSGETGGVGLLRHKRDREGDMKNFEWNFSVESPSIQVNSPSSLSTFQPERQRVQQQNNNVPEISVQFFNGFKSLGAPGENTSRLKLEEREGAERKAEGWDGSKSVFIGATPNRSCCGPNYPFRNSCCQM